MDAPLTLGLLGAALYPAALQINAHRNGETYTGTGLGLNAAVGGGVGYSIGELLQGAANLWRRRQMDKTMEAMKPGTKAEIRKILNQPEFRHIPAYQQVDGDSIDNAYYADGSLPLADTENWRDIRTGKTPDEFQDRAIYIGKGFNHVPIVAHELGHAHDLRNTSRGANIGLALLYAAGMGASFGGGLLMNQGVQEKNWDSAKVGAVIMAAGLGGLGLSRYITNKRERAASDIAIQTLERMRVGRKKLDDANKLLQSAYATYDPIQFSEPEFGSARYGKL